MKADDLTEAQLMALFARLGPHVLYLRRLRDRIAHLGFEPVRTLATRRAREPAVCETWCIMCASDIANVGANYARFTFPHRSAPGIGLP
jgi:hypothetical protein